MTSPTALVLNSQWLKIVRAFAYNIVLKRWSLRIFMFQKTVKRLKIPSVATVGHNYNSRNSVSMIWVILPFCSFVLRNNFLVSISKIWNHIAIKLGCYEIYRLDTRKYEKYRLGRLPQRSPCRPRRYFSYFLGLVSIFHIILVWKRYIPYFLV